MSYTQSEWILLFFLYCILGWVWESCYVSVRKGSWVNRGFLYGPWLPIYGSGAIVILLSTLGVTGSPALVFLLGMISSTILEYVTGAVMEALFHVRYWDYSQHKCNLDGHICLSVSLGWGCFSLFLVYILHPPIGHLVQLIPSAAAQTLTHIFIILFVVDATKSVQAALGLKELMRKLTESNQHLEHLEEHLAAALEHLSEGPVQVKEKLLQAEYTASQKIEAHQAVKEAHAQNRREYLLEKLTEQRDKKSRLLSHLDRQAVNGLYEVRQKLAETQDESQRLRLEKAQEALTQVQTALRKAESDMAGRKNREFQRAVSLLYRNPSAVSHKHKAAFAQLRQLMRLNEKERH